MKNIYIILIINLCLLIGISSSQIIADMERPVNLPVANLTIDDIVPDIVPVLHNPIFPPMVGPNVIVSGPQFYSPDEPPYGLLGRSETTIAVGPFGKHVIIGWNDADGFLVPLELEGLTGYGYSVDGGRTFQDGNGLPPGTYEGLPVVPRGDPWLDNGDIGNAAFFFANLAARPISQGFAGVGMIVHKGIFLGNRLIWGRPDIITPPSPDDFLDKEAMAADKRLTSRAVYICVTNFTPNGSQIELYRTLNGGRTWMGPTVVKEPDPLGQQGSAVAVGPNGEVYVTWERGRFTGTPDILFRASFDQGATFGPLQLIKNITGTALYPPVGYNRTGSNDFPRIAVDNYSIHKGRIYVTFQDANNNPFIHTNGVFVNTSTGEEFATGGVNDGDIYVSYSDDHGNTWSEPTLVSSATPGDGKDQFWPVVSVQPSGNVDIFYYQDTEYQPQPPNPLATNISVGSPYRRHSSYQSLVDVYWAESLDGGKTFLEPVRLNEETSNWSIAATNIIPNFGDYIFSVSFLNMVYASWAQSVLYDIDPGPAVNERYVPSVAFAKVKSFGLPVPKEDIAASVLTLAPATFELAQNYPNPFNPSTDIRFRIPDASQVSLIVYNTLGQEIKTLVNDYYEAGEHTVAWDGRDNNGQSLPSGIYFYQIEAGAYKQMKKMMMIK